MEREAPGPGGKRGPEREHSVIFKLDSKEAKGAWGKRRVVVHRTAKDGE